MIYMCMRQYDVFYLIYVKGEGLRIELFLGSPSLKLPAIQKDPMSFTFYQMT